MPANRDKKTGKWNCQFYYTDWTGKKVKKMKRGFETKKEAQDWERHFKLEKASSLDMTFGDFYRRYEADVKPKVRENTWQSKVWVIEKKILQSTGQVDEALRTLENNIEREQVSVNKRRCMILEHKTMMYVIFIAMDLMAMILYCIIMKLLEMQIGF